MESLVYIPLLLLAILPAFVGMAQHNLLVALRNRTREAWGGLDTELRRRYELVPRLVEAARGSAADETGVSARLIEQRDRCASNRGAISSQAVDEAGLVGALRDFLAGARPGPGAESRFRALRDELAAAENRIQAARRRYDGQVRAYQQKCGSFPGSLIARMFGFPAMAFFPVEPAIPEAPAAPKGR